MYKVLSRTGNFDFLDRIYRQNEFSVKNRKSEHYNSKFMTSQPDNQAIEKDILPNISPSKGNQTMKFGQLVD